MKLLFVVLMFISFGASAMDTSICSKVYKNDMEILAPLNSYIDREKTKPHANQAELMTLSMVLRLAGESAKNHREECFKTRSMLYSSLKSTQELAAIQHTKYLTQIQNDKINDVKQSIIEQQIAKDKLPK